MTILLKGWIDIIADKKRLQVNKTGHPGMTVGGTGDVLAGILGALFYHINDAFHASYLASYISGKAGELAASKFGDGLVASDILDYIAQMIKYINGIIAIDLTKEPVSAAL